LPRFPQTPSWSILAANSEVVDVYTLANALTGFADTAYAVNETIDPAQEIEIIVEVLCPEINKRARNSIAPDVVSDNV
jgi:hypothetical protein